MRYILAATVLFLDLKQECSRYAVFTGSKFTSRQCPEKFNSDFTWLSYNFNEKHFNAFRIGFKVLWIRKLLRFLSNLFLLTFSNPFSKCWDYTQKTFLFLCFSQFTNLRTKSSLFFVHTFSLRFILFLNLLSWLTIIPFLLSELVRRNFNQKQISLNTFTMRRKNVLIHRNANTKSIRFS